jgi:hypothetical protein
MTIQEQQEQIANGLAELAALHGTMLTNLSAGAGQQGRSNNAANPVVTMGRPWVNPPEGFIPYDNRSKIALGIVGVTSIVLTMQVPQGYDGVINAYSWNFTGGGFVQASGDLTIKILRNNTPIRNFDNITVEAGTIAQPRLISPIRLYSGQVISIVVTHTGNNLLSGDVVGCLSGYFYPSMG